MFLLLSTIFVTFLSLTNSETSDDLLILLRDPEAKVRGHILKSFLEMEYYGFQDIPYAEPPIGENRFAEPKPHNGWSEVLNATKNRKICTQEGRPESSEDCLVLNVYTPVRNSSAKLPVLFWIHGGSYISGSGEYEYFNPKYFMDYAIIVVTINYRLGPFGFLTTEDGIIPGNLGLKDQQLALKWVNKNIVQFGGDPHKVTIAGQSVGSNSVGHHMIHQKSSGLYRAAIMQSSSALVQTTLVSDPRNYSLQLGQLLNPNFTSKDTRELLDILRRASKEDILKFSGKVKNTEKPVGILPDLTWSITIENQTNGRALVADPMHLSLMNGKFDKVPLMIGFTSLELIRFIGSVDSLMENARKHDEDISKLVTLKWNVPEEEQMVLGEKLKQIYTNDSFSRNLDRFISISNDMGFVYPIIRQAKLSSQFVPTFLYRFSYKGAAHMKDTLNLPGVDGVAHGEEIFYMWNMTFQNTTDIQISKRLLTMWSNFVKYLNPTPDGDPSLGVSEWPQLDPKNLKYLDIDSQLQVGGNLQKYHQSEKIYMEYLRDPLHIF